MTDAELMQVIRNGFGQAIAMAVRGSSFLESFLAALVANETGEQIAAGGTSAALYANRFEPAVFASLAEVIVARKPAFGAIGALDLMKIAWPLDAVNAHTGAQPAWGFKEGLAAMVNLASSWGPTQIMGYHRIELDFPLSDLTSISRHFLHAVELLNEFRQRFPALDEMPAVHFYPSLFRCWNTGSPTGATFDQKYVPSGVARMKLYAYETIRSLSLTV